VFKTFNILAFYVSIDAILFIYTSGRTMGLIIDLGHTVTYVVPTYEGFTLLYAISRVDITGSDLMDYIMKILADRGYTFITIVE